MQHCRDDTNGFQLYQSDPSGNYGGWKATAIGANHQGAQNILKQDYKEEITLEEATKLIIKVPRWSRKMHQPVLSTVSACLLLCVLQPVPCTQWCRTVNSSRLTACSRIQLHTSGLQRSAAALIQSDAYQVSSLTQRMAGVLRVACSYRSSAKQWTAQL